MTSNFSVRPSQLLATLALAALLAGCAAPKVEAPPPPAPVAVVIPPIGLSPRVVEQASAYRAYVTHGVLSGAAVERVNASILKELVMTDSISPPERAGDGGKIRYVSCDRLIGEAIRRIANEESVSKLFD